ncbi:MAG: hypothetical protein JRJ14_09400 [Deltaproteobacteria bacterium]|nr:hypothetical protein [Deltaproteobacteria bacterium]
MAAQRDRSHLRKLAKTQKKIKRVEADKLKLSRELLQAVAEVDASVWKAIDEQARTFKDSATYSTYWPQYRDAVTTLIPHVNQISNLRAFDATLNIVAGYIDAINHLYHPEKGIINNALAELKREEGPETEKIAESIDEETKIFADATVDFRRKHRELTLKGRNADNEAKTFAKVLLEPVYKDIYTKIKLICLKKNILVVPSFLREVIKSEIVDRDDYMRVLAIRDIAENILSDWKGPEEDAKYTIHLPWSEMTVRDDTAPEQEVSEEITARRTQWLKLAETLIDIIGKAGKNIGFNRFPVKLDAGGRLSDPSLLGILPAMGYVPYISNDGLYELLKNPESYTSVEVLPLDETHPPELLIHLNREKKYFFNDMQLGYDAGGNEKNMLRIVLFKDSLVNRDVRSYADLVEGNRLKTDDDGIPLVVHRLRNKVARPALQHYFMDYQVFYDTFITCAGKNDLSRACAEKLQKVKRRVLSNVQEITEIIPALKETKRETAALKRADMYVKADNVLRGLRAVKEALRKFPGNEALQQEEERLMRRIQRDSLIKRISDAVDRGSLITMREARDALTGFYLEADEEVTIETLREATEGDGEVILAWWNITRAIEEEERRLWDIRDELTFAMQLVKAKNFNLAEEHVAKAVELGVDHKTRMIVLARIEKAKKLYTEYLFLKKEYTFASKEAEEVDDIEGIEGITARLKTFESQISGMGEYEEQVKSY